MTRHELATAITEDVAARSTWDTRQSQFYEMRHHGLRRTRKPWPAASDVHFPLSSSSIESLKPHYFQQLYATELIADFRPLETAESVSVQQANLAAQWFDQEMKQKTDLEVEALCIIDQLLVGGRMVGKVYWDGALRIEAVPITQIIVPSWTKNVKTADRIVHVLQYSVESFKRQSWAKGVSEQDIKLITGCADQEPNGSELLTYVKEIREGITHSRDNQIIIWECWTRADDGGWQCEYMSPIATDVEIRPKFKNPYNHKRTPFVAFVQEIKDSGWYSPRGICELLAMSEAQCNATLNEKNDWMAFCNKPMFTSDRDIPNSGALKVAPGVVHRGVTPMEQSRPAIDFDAHLQLMQSIGEGLVKTPDFGLSNQQGKSSKDPRTATEMQAVTAVSSQSSDLRMRVFRLGLGELYRLCWSILLQYKAAGAKVWINDRVEPVTPDILKDVYRISPSGSADGVNKQMAYAKAVARFQMFNGDPFINQAELRKSVLENDDPALVKRLFRDPGVTAANQAEDQAEEIAIMRIGFPAAVSPADDHDIHLKTLLGYITHQSQMRQQPGPSEMQMIQQHAAAHIEALKQTNPKQAKAAQLAFQSLGEELSAGQAEQQQPARNGQPTGVA